MAKDYANRTSNSRRAPSKRKKSRTALWVIIILLLIAVSAGGLYVYKHFWDVMQFHALKTHKATKSPIPLPEEANKQELVTPQFEFYNILSNGKNSAPAPSNTAPASTPAAAPVNKKSSSAPVISATAVPAKSGYMVQIASFKISQQAEQLKAKLALQGISTRVNHGSDGWYRVQAGPYSSADTAQKAQQQLQQAGYKGIVRKNG
ncbi:MAG: SPOR domain-containing protein [Gammaproteobacteria bacterium]|nr:SPOR domain-containing protein [Gammaproteobacteria bacterium]